MTFINKKGIIIGGFVVLSLLTISSILLAYNFYDNNKLEQNNSIVSEVDAPKEEVETNIYVEVKGAVKKPGVYEVNNESIINDVIKMAGGFLKTAYTNNINLSRRVTNELVVYIFTKTEYNKKSKKAETVKEETSNVCVCEDYNIEPCTDNYASVITSDNTPNENNVTVENNQENVITNENNAPVEEKKESSNQKININTASLTELTTLNGVGEKKAQAIIDYRTQNGNFKTIEEIMNISGIGEATFAKFKNDITV